jgi:choline dehydrogenase-like flavoprotein
MKPIGSMDRIRSAIAGQHIQARASFFSPGKAFLFVNDRKNPYTCPPDDFYLWIRGRNVGGRFLTWGRVALRMSDYDFKAASLDGIGDDWPISYADLVPYYDRVEQFPGITEQRTASPICRRQVRRYRPASRASNRGFRRRSNPVAWRKSFLALCG